MVIDNVQDEDIFLGMRMLIEDAIDGEGIFEENVTGAGMAQIQNELLKNSNIKEEQVMQIMQPVMQMNKTQMKAERTLRSLKRSNEDMEYELRKLHEEKILLKQEIEDLLNY